MDRYLLALDAGTGSVRAVIFSEEGVQIGVSQHEWAHLEDERWPGSMGFNWVKNWKLTKDCIKQVFNETGIDPQSIAAISTTCMREGIVLYDQDGKEIWACANVDARSNDEVSELIQSYPNLEKELYHISGQTYALGALPRLLWVKNKLPDIYAQTYRLGMFNDWLIYKLTGELILEPSNGSTTGFMNLKTRDWDLSIPNHVSLRDDIFGAVQEPGTVAGKVSKLASEETGLAEGTLVVVGGGDCQLGMIGVNACRANEAAVFGGSFWQYEFNTDICTTDPKCRTRVNCHAIPDMWQYEALAIKPGLVMRWFRDAFCQHEKAIAENTNRDVYDVLNEYAETVSPGCNGMMCCFSDVMNYIHWTHASPTFTNFELDSDKFNKYTFYRAILENTAYLVRGHIELVKEATGKEPESIIFAGGASKSKLWAQILADITEKPVKIPVVKEATALGAAILAGYGAGIYSSISEGAERTVKFETEIIPNSNHFELYRELYKTWRSIYREQLELSEKGITKSLWRAPGL